MTVNNLGNIFISEVLRNRPDLNDFTKGSVLYTLSRAVAATANEVYLEVQNLQSRGLLLDENIDEDLLTNISPALSKQPGTLAKGSVLVSNLSNTNIFLPTGTALIEPINGIQFNTTEDITANTLAELSVPVVAAADGTIYNLSAGTSLINANYTQLLFVVGNTRSSDNTAIGDLSGGTAIESQEIYLTRLRNSLLNQRVSQQQALINYLVAKDNILSANIVVLAGGLVTIWVESSSTLTIQELAALNTEIEEFIPIGTYSQVKQFTLKPISVRLFSFETINLVTENIIIELVENYLTQIPIGGSVSPTAIRNLISERTGILLKVITPTEVTTLLDGEKIVSNGVEITIDAT